MERELNAAHPGTAGVAGGDPAAWLAIGIVATLLVVVAVASGFRRDEAETGLVVGVSPKRKLKSGMLMVPLRTAGPML